MKEAVKVFRTAPSEKLLQKVFRALDRAAKKNVLHANRTARLKSRLSKLLNKKVGKHEKKFKPVKKNKTSEKNNT